MKWNRPPATVLLSPDEVHVWRAALDLPGPALQRLRQTLSPEELERAARYHFNRDRRRFVVRWAALRDIIGRYLDMAPRQLQFVLGQHGKPSIAPGLNQSDVQFNVAHSGDVALVAITLENEVGVDVERQRENVAHADLAERFFTPAEAAALRELPPAKQDAAFFGLWTCKEAYLKGTGMGLSLGLDSFSVSYSSDGPQVWLNTGDEARPAGQWTLRQLEPGPPYFAALAVNKREWQLKCWQWPGTDQPS
ncbi:MAG: 4'-phosphopantetheinyl transferase superfamily protein [Chloroflexota bacterium]|nr:MAG: 4'-phosphopantetheinyl transferase superfamily protein [Chloroflexota bacterium]